MDITIRRNPVSIPILPIIAVVLLAILSLWTMRVGSINGSQIGVFVNNLSGNIDVVVRPGSQFYCGIYTDFYVIDNTVQSLRMADVNANKDALDIKTRDGSDVHLDVALNYRLVQDSKVIAERVIPECGLATQYVQVAVDRGRQWREVDAYKLKWARDYARAVIRYKFGEMKTDDFYSSGERARKGLEAEAELNQLLRPHGIEVMNLVPERFRFYEEYEKKISEKKAADQEVQSQEQIALATLESQKKRKAEATAVLNVEIARLDGELRTARLSLEGESTRAKLEAEAYAFTTQTNAEAMFVQAQNEAQGQLARAKAEAEGMRALAASLAGEGGLNLVRLEYAKALQKAVITGVPYSTDPRIQKVELETKEKDK